MMRSAAETVAAARRGDHRPEHGLPGAEGLQDRRRRRAIKDPDTAVAVARAAVEGSGLPVTVKLRSGQKPGRDRRLRPRAPARRGGRRLGDRLPPAQRGRAPQGRPGLRPRRASSSTSLPAPVILTGGLRDREAVLAAYERTGAAAVMLARGSLGNPWLFEELLGRTHRKSDRRRDPRRARLDDGRRRRALRPERAARWMRKAYPWYMERLGRGQGGPGAPAGDRFVRRRTRGPE